MNIPLFNALITTYETVMSDYNTLKVLPWQVLVVDEGHKLKNAVCRFHFRVIDAASHSMLQASKTLERLMEFNVDYKILLTGTPLQNNMGELFTLLNFMQPEEFLLCRFSLSLCFCLFLSHSHRHLDCLCSVTRTTSCSDTETCLMPVKCRS